MFLSSHFLFLVLVPFDVTFVYILQSKMGKMGKMEKIQKENRATKVTKIPKTKRQKYGMNQILATSKVLIFQEGRKKVERNLSIIFDIFN